jgi:DeoR/GlpR family transcriptional regulator of sugar metabolism
LQKGGGGKIRKSSACGINSSVPSCSEIKKTIKMIKSERERKILELLAAHSRLSVDALQKEIGPVSPISIRRDLARLAARGDLLRTHGGAVAKRNAPEGGQEVDAGIKDVDAIILPPVGGRAAETLRMVARRRRIPFLAESSPQPGGTYLGPDNEAAGRDLGQAAGRMLAGSLKEACILLVSLEQLSNTQARCDGFLAGFKDAFPGSVRHWRVNGCGSFRISLQASLDILETQPGVNVVFGVNDHSILAALDAAARLRTEVAGFSVGGEGGALFEKLAENAQLKACAALFPEIVGMRAIDVLADALAGAGMPDSVQTPHVVLTPATMGDFYHRSAGGFVLSPDAPARLGLPARLASRHTRSKAMIGFVPHYPAHDWYRSMARAMERRAVELGLELRVSAPTAEIAREIRDLRRLIAAAAAARVGPGDTVLINAGLMAMPLAEALTGARHVTVVTNAFDVLEHLSGRADLKVILTSGEYQAKDRCLVGPSLGALFETLRVDKAFLSVDGISAQFGASMSDERLALAARRFVEASREVFVLADHSLVGVEANHRIAPPRALHELITDPGSLPVDRLACAAAGMRVSLADENSHVDEMPA